MKMYNNFCHQKIESNIDLKASTAEALSVIERGAHLASEKNFISYYCKIFINKITYTEDEQLIYNFYIDNIIKKKHFNGELKEADIRLFTQYLSLKQIHDLNLRTHFEILPDYLYTLKYGIFSSCSCHSFKDGSSIIYLRDQMFRKILDRGHFLDPERLYTLFEHIYHELRHAKQTDIIHNELITGINSKEVLMWIKENIIDHYDPIYYYRNHNDMFRERDADIKAKFKAIDTIKEHFNYFDAEIIENFNKKALDYYQNTIELVHLDPQGGYRTSGEATEVIDSYFDRIVLKYPKYLPTALFIQYNPDGQKKNSSDIVAQYNNEIINFKEDSEALGVFYDLYDYLIRSANNYDLNSVKTKKLK